MVRRSRAELDELVTQLIRYLDYTDQDGKNLTVRDLSKLLDISKSRVGQLINELDAGRYSHLRSDDKNPN